MKKKNKDIGIKVDEIKEISFSNKLTKEIIDNKNEENVYFKLGVGVNGDSSKGTVTIALIVSYLFETEFMKNPIEFLELETETTYHFIDFTEDELKYLDDENKIYINDDLMAFLLETSLGATRGMLAYKTASLPINLVLPLIDVDEFMESKKNNDKNHES